ncbi:MAG: hypothetical protein RIC55_35920 [Pirellulaceae bacterium]
MSAQDASSPAQTASTTLWRLADSDCGARLAAHRRLPAQGRAAVGAESLRLDAGRGSYAYLVHQVPPARVIDELSPGVWIKSDRAGLQVLVRVVLPRTKDARTGSPVTVLLGGKLYDDVGKWQLLSLSNVPLLLERQQRVLRTQLGPTVDIREAYVDLLLLNAYGGLGSTNVMIGEASMAGSVAPPEDPRPETGGAPNVVAATLGSPPAGAGQITSESAVGDGGASTPRLHGSVLVADARPLLVRAIEHQGEPLDWLRSAGFNAVVLDRPPTVALLGEAARTGMWLVAPPPHIASGGRITSNHARVLAWDLGKDLEADDRERIRQLAAEVRRDDPVSGRPLVCNPMSGLWQYSRLADIFAVHRDPLGSSFDLADYGDWLGERMRLARPGTPLWATVQTQYTPQMTQQWSALAGDEAAQTPVDPRQVRLLTYAAVAAGARGIVFASHSRLDGSTPEEQLRAANLKLINHHLRLLEPWAAGGDRLRDVESSSTSVDVSVLQTDRSRVLLVQNESPGQQHVIAPTDRATVSLLSGSAPSSAQVYRMASGDLEPLPHQRVTGGLRMTLDRVGLFSLVVVSQEPLVVSHFKRLLAEESAMAARLEQEVTTAWLTRVERTYEQLASGGKPFPAAPALLADAKLNLRRGRDVLETRDPRSSQLYTERAANSLARLRRGVWEQTSSSFPSPVSSPFCATFETLPWHWALAERLAAASWTGNLLPGSDMEQLEFMLRSGWRRQTRQESPVDAAVELSPQAAHAGDAGLRLRAYTSDENSKVAVLEAPPIWIISPPVGVRRGQVVRIHGWAHLPAPLTGSREGLLVYDSLGGPALAERITQTGQWREFTLYRLVPQDGDVRLTFALTGVGEAWIDDVTVQLATPPSASARGITPPFR